MYKLSILTTKINPETISEMVNSAQAEAQKLGAEIVSVTKTVGTLDMPVIAKHLLKQENIDGLVILGAVAKGETKHDEVVVKIMTMKIMDLSLTFNKPVGFGVIGPSATKEQFKPRAAEYARRAVEAVITNLDILN
ncbi:MAG: 6,7-dimethyl-8-ribityllumazine synthase [Patescibacteria group bacterium]|jgi:6,7-dimethyl-8-ribityllumazine synthase